MGITNKGLAGFGTERTSSPRQIMATMQGILFVPQGKIINGTYAGDADNTGDVDVLRAGLLMGKITSGGKYRNSIIGLSTSAFSSGATSIAVSAATATEVARIKAAAGGGNLSLKFIQAATDAAAGAIVESAITVTAVTINGASSTLTISALAADKVTSAIIAPADGAEYPRTLVYDENGIKVSNDDGTREDCQYGLLVCGGVVDSNQIINLPTGAAIQAWIKAKLRLASPALTFTDDF